MWPCERMLPEKGKCPSYWRPDQEVERVMCCEWREPEAFRVERYTFPRWQWQAAVLEWLQGIPGLRLRLPPHLTALQFREAGTRCSHDPE
ncbi:hypothetical protein E2C01_100658 [Portunus trituberculatus]|uniref:Uncharacterized protein n=1 Tax=Portunus trituberculatus TaxID=210409 RepID=A0A5B7KDU6_PORTR|nr:hypothetical protein [Portunus trituberculatus]